MVPPIISADPVMAKDPTPCETVERLQRFCSPLGRDIPQVTRNVRLARDTLGPNECICNPAFLDLWDSCLLTPDYDGSLPLYDDWENLCAQLPFPNHAPPSEEYGEPPAYRSSMMLLFNRYLSRRAVEDKNDTPWSPIQIALPVIVVVVLTTGFAIFFYIYRRTHAPKQSKDIGRGISFRGPRRWLAYGPFSSIHKVREANRSSVWSIDALDDVTDEFEFVEPPSPQPSRHGHVRLSSSPPRLERPHGIRVNVVDGGFPEKSMWKSVWEGTKEIHWKWLNILPWRRRTKVVSRAPRRGFRIDDADVSTQSPMSMRPVSTGTMNDSEENAISWRGGTLDSYAPGASTADSHLQPGSDVVFGGHGEEVDDDDSENEADIQAMGEEDHLITRSPNDVMLISRPGVLDFESTIESSGSSGHPISPVSPNSLEVVPPSPMRSPVRFSSPVPKGQLHPRLPPAPGYLAPTPSNGPPWRSPQRRQPETVAQRGPPKIPHQLSKENLRRANAAQSPHGPSPLSSPGQFTPPPSPPYFRKTSADNIKRSYAHARGQSSGEPSVSQTRKSSADNLRGPGTLSPPPPPPPPPLPNFYASHFNPNPTSIPRSRTPGPSPSENASLSASHMRSYSSENLTKPPRTLDSAMLFPGPVRGAGYMSTVNTSSESMYSMASYPRAPPGVRVSMDQPSRPRSATPR